MRFIAKPIRHLALNSIPAIFLICVSCASMPDSNKALKSKTDADLVKIKNNAALRFVAARPDIRDASPETVLSEHDKLILSILRLKTEALFWEQWREQCRTGYLVSFDSDEKQSTSKITNSISSVHSYTFDSVAFNQTPLRVAVNAISQEVTSRFPSDGFNIVFEEGLGDKEITFSALYFSLADTLSLLSSQCNSTWAWDGNVVKIQKTTSNNPAQGTAHKFAVPGP